MRITPFYAALFGLLFVALSVRTLRLRRRLQIAVGDSGNLEMLRATRAHSNFAEYVPLCLLLVHFAEVQSAPAGLVHMVCIGFLVGRLSHAYGISQVAEDFRFRVFGMAATLTTVILTSLYLIVGYLQSAGTR